MSGKIESGQFSLNLGEYAIESVVETVRAATESLAETKKLNMEIQPTPPETIAKLNAAAVAAVRHPEVAEKLGKLSAVPVGSTPAELEAITRLEHERWGKLIRERKLTVN